MLQSVVLCSKKNFQITEQGDSVEFLKWFLNALHLALGGTKKHSSSIIYKTFSGGMRIHSKKILPTELTDDAKKAELLASGEYDWKVTESPFLYLTCELPPPPLFRDEHLNNIIPQVSLFTLLGKFNGETEKEYKTYKDNIIRRFELTRLPPVSIVLTVQCGKYGNLLSLFFGKNFVKVIVVGWAEAQPTSVRQQIRILDIFATFDALFEKNCILEVFATFDAL